VLKKDQNVWTILSKFQEPIIRFSMLRIWFILLLVLQFTLVTIAQDKLNPDSLTRLLPSLMDTSKIRAYYEICKYWLGVDKEKSLAAAQAAVHLSDSLEDKIWMARSLNFLVTAKSNHGDYKEALPFAKKALLLARESQYQPQILESLENCSIIFSILGYWDQTLEYAQQGLELAREIHDTIGILNNSNAIASTYQELKEYAKAELIFKESVVMADRIGRLFEKGRANANLGLLYAAEFRWQDCKDYSKKGAEDFHQLQYPTGEAQALLSVAEAQYYLGQTPESENTCFKIIELVKEADNAQIEGSAYMQLGRLSLLKDDLTQATAYLEIAESKSKRVQDFGLMKEVFETQENLAIIQRDFEKAKYYQIQSQIAADSFLSQNVLSKIADYQVRYQTAEKEAQISVQNLILEREKNRRNLLLIGLTLALLSIIGIAQYFSNRQKLKQKEARIILQLEQAETEKLRELDSIKSIFFANISHEFRTPLTLILSPLEQLLSGSLEGDLQKYYRLIYRNALRLLELVNQLLDLSKIESGKMKMQVSHADLGHFVLSIVQSFESLAAKRQITLHVDIPSQPLRCYFDKDKVEKVLSNLISNALKFTPEGGQVWVNLALHDSNLHKVTLLVKDNGIGIPADQLPTIFDRFAHTTASELQPGSGIGLALTKELVSVHGGTIIVESTEGDGTTFKVQLTVDEHFFKKEEIITSPIARLSGSPTRSLGQERSITTFSLPVDDSAKPILLIVEDHQELRQYIKEQFIDTYIIFEAENGQTGIELALKHIPDVIITDIMMPEVDGIQLSNILKSNEKVNHIPIVMLTARSDMEDKLAGLATGADDYLTKPFNASEIIMRVSNLVHQRKKIQEHFRNTLSNFSASPIRVESMDSAFIHKLRECVQKHLDDEKFSVIELGHELGLSRSQLYRKVLALTGYAPNEIIRNMRLERAKQLLEQRAGTVSEIAFLCGFSAPAYFIKCFREHFGITPGEL
jgi:signal transduction histidine kinase/DNA-binding response OmpR family regulator